MSDPAERKPRIATFEGVPLDIIRDARTKWERVSVRMQRRVAGGKLAGLGQKMMTLEELSNIETFLKEKAGGGNFRIEPRDPMDLLSYADPIPPFTLDIEGPPKPATPWEHTGQRVPFFGGVGSMGAAVDSGLVIPPEAAAQIPNWVPQEERVAWLQQANPAAVASGLGLQQPVFNPHQQRQAPAAAFASDQLAVKQLDELRAEVAADRARAAQREKLLQEQLELSRKEIERHKDEERSLREKGERDVVKLQMDAFRAEIAALKSAPVAPPKAPAVPPEVWVGLAGAIAPVVVSLIQSSAARQADMASQQAQVAKLQMDGLNTVLGAANGKKSDLSGLVETALKLAPIAVPVLQEFYKNKSPAAQANLFSTLMEGNLTTLSTMGSFLQTMMEMQGGDPWWRPMVENGIQGVVAAAQQYSEMAVQQNGGKAAAAPAAPAQPQRQSSPGTTMATMIVNNPQFPRELKNGAWVEVIAALHDKAPPTNIAQFVRDELIEMRDKQALPEIFANVFQTPEQSVGALISFLPIYKADRAYADSVIQAIGQAVRAATVVDTEGEAEAQESDDDGDAEEAETPAAVPFNLNAVRGNGARIPVPVGAR